MERRKGSGSWAGQAGEWQPCLSSFFYSPVCQSLALCQLPGHTLLVGSCQAMRSPTICFSCLSDPQRRTGGFSLMGKKPIPFFFFFFFKGPSKYPNFMMLGKKSESKNENKCLYLLFFPIGCLSFLFKPHLHPGSSCPVFF